MEKKSTSSTGGGPYSNKPNSSSIKGGSSDHDKVNIEVNSYIDENASSYN
jgi:hypothetical protein